MKLFLDTAFVEEIKAAKEWGILDGVTTNPTLVAKTGKGFMEVVQDILSMVEGPVSLEVVAQDAQGMVKQARQLRSLGEQVVVKIPATQEGIKAVKILSQEGIPTNVTLVFQPLQALLAAKAGATYVSPFVGRLEDIGHDAMDLVFDIKHIFDNYGFETQIIVASVRHPKHVLDAARMGANICTVPFKVMEQLFKHALTDKGLELFLADWSKVPGRPF
ncbi:MAG: fructose-6-phosphate aldolase [Coprothermobacter proteolyticus]